MQQEEVILQITDLSRGGAGVARQESGRVVFVPFTAPGDRVRARILESKKHYAQGELLEVIEASPMRQPARCPAFGRCGGCQWQHIPYDFQWRTKVKGVLHALARVKLEPPGGRLEELPAERIWEYRNRIQLRGEGREIGFFAARSRERVQVDRCDIARPEINAVWEEVREEGSRLSMRDSHRSRVAGAATRPGSVAAFAYKVEVEVLGDGSVRKYWNAGHAAGGFRQVHDEQNERLRAWVKEAVGAEGKPVLDLFGGSGNLSLQLAGTSREIHCVDTSAPGGSSQDLPAGFSFHRSQVLPWLLRRRNLSEQPRPWAVIVDPPREGLGAELGEIASSVERLGADRLIAVGCDPDAWVRDLSRYVKRGWRLERAAALDLFPQTPHVESLALLTLTP